MRISWDLRLCFLIEGHNKDYADISWFVIQYIHLIAVTTMTTVCVFNNFWYSWSRSKQVTDISWLCLTLPSPPPSWQFLYMGKIFVLATFRGSSWCIFMKSTKKTDWPQLWYVNSGGEQDIMGVGWKEVGGRQKVAIVRPWAKTGLGEHGFNKNLYICNQNIVRNF